MQFVFVVCLMCIHVNALPMRTRTCPLGGADQVVARGSSPLAGGGARGRVTFAPLQESCVTISRLSNFMFSFLF